MFAQKATVTHETAKSEEINQLPANPSSSDFETVMSAGMNALTLSI
jgi:hypothetical protein